MESLALFFSSSGRIAPKPLAIGVLVVTISFLFYAVIAVLVLIFLPLLIALGFSIWVGTRRAKPASGTPATGAP